MEYHNCRCCECKYEEHPKDRISRSESRYNRYLGICSDECKDKITEKGLNELNLHAFLFGDARKRNRVKLPKTYLKKKSI